MKNIVIINGHPGKDSLCQALANAYKTGVEKSKAICTLINLHELTFDPVLHFGYKSRTELEPDLIYAQKTIQNADHLVFVYPNWWGTSPALLKGFIDRVFIPGFAFKYRENSIRWEKLLKGKSARVLVTMDSPKWYYSIFNRKPGHHAIKKSILHFCGVNPVKISTFCPVKSSGKEQREKWIKKVEALGSKGL